MKKEKKISWIKIIWLNFVRVILSLKVWFKINLTVNAKSNHTSFQITVPLVKSGPKEKPASLVIGNTFLHGWDCEQSKGLSFIMHLKKIW